MIRKHGIGKPAKVPESLDHTSDKAIDAHRVGKPYVASPGIREGGDKTRQVCKFVVFVDKGKDTPVKLELLSWFCLVAPYCYLDGAWRTDGTYEVSKSGLLTAVTEWNYPFHDGRSGSKPTFYQL